MATETGTLTGTEPIKEARCSCLAIAHEQQFWKKSTETNTLLILRNFHLLTWLPQSEYKTDPESSALTVNPNLRVTVSEMPGVEKSYNPACGYIDQRSGAFITSMKLAQL